MKLVDLMHEAAEIGGYNGELLIREILRSNPSALPRHDPMHIINRRNLKGQTPLYTSIVHGNYLIVKLLIEEGCDPTLKSSLDGRRFESNLQVAALFGHYEIL